MELKSRKQHLAEFKKEIYRLIIPMVLLFILFFSLSKPMITYLLTFYNLPLTSIVSITPFESLQTSLIVAGTLTLLFSLPLILQGTLRYCKELIKPKIYKKSHKVIFTSYLLAILGSAFGIFLFSKLVLQNMISSYTLTTASWSILAVFNFIIISSITFALAMQMIIIIPAMVSIGLVKKQTLKKIRFPVVIGIMICSAIATPPDVVSMLIMSLPIYGAFEMGILFSKNKLKQEEKC